ncbi:molybdenum cofactor guanylyltransferase [Candidatus Pelagibacter sp.]|uniref:molybdenum cofactor guanylyltransferase n=1 Tax=Candidatus Pelagibacter sp. TaxID=2024849 RepID=UPI003F844BD9
MEHNKILGVVLAGGKSLRFGRDKSQAILGNKNLINHVLDKILIKFDEILIVANHKIKFNKNDKIDLISDYYKDLGPLGGIYSAMKWIKDNNKPYEWIISFPTDTPFFEAKILDEFLNKTNEKEKKLFFIKSNNKRHNIFGLWSLDLFKSLEKDLLENNERKVETWANKIGVETININFEGQDPFFNINTTDDLEKAKKYI